MLAFEDLNQAQRDAVTFPFDRALKVTAGAGTGKTSVITLRFLEALRRVPGVSASNILCLTFTERAADSMCRRISEALGRQAESADLWVHTFHSFCARILSQYARPAELPPGYRVADEGETMLLRDDVAASLLSDGSIQQQERSLIPPGSLRNVLTGAWAIIDCAMRNLHTPESLEAALNLAQDPETSHACYGRQVGMIAVRLFREFQSAKRAAGILDYADLIGGLYRLLCRHDGIRAEMRSRFSYILVDEFQDTDRAQFELLRLLAKGGCANVTVVGDDKQAIYEWRGSRIENLREFAAEELFLTFNYRSYNEILDLANFSIARDPFFQARAERIRLENPEKGYGTGGHVRLVRRQSRTEEAAYIAEETERLISSGVRPGDIAVLYRSTTHTKILEDQFRGLGIPYTALGGGFYEREEIRDLLAYLELATDPTADEAAVRVLGRPPVSLTSAQIARIATGRQVPLLEMFRDMHFLEQLGPEPLERVQTALSCLERLMGERRMAPLAVLIESALYESGYFDVLAAQSRQEAPRGISNISKIVDLAADFQSRSPDNGLLEFVRYLQRLLALEPLREAEADPQQEADAVKLLTVHAAKGLEFHTVFMADVRNKRFRKDNAFLLEIPPASDAPGPGRIVAKRLPGFRKESEEYNEFLEKRDAKARHDQEERRIFYVALTRAKENLYLTTTADSADFFDELASEFANCKRVEINPTRESQ